MNQVIFPHCCTVEIIYDFGESELAEGGDYPQDEDILFTHIENAIRRHSGNGRFNPGKATLLAITNNDQKITNKVLRKFGFKHSTWLSKDAHPESKIRIWWYPLKGVEHGEDE